VVAEPGRLEEQHEDIPLAARWNRTWSVIAGAMLAVAGGVCLADGAISAAGKAAAAALSLLWGTWYWFFVIRARRWQKQPWALVVTFVLAVVVAAILSWIHGVFVLLLFSFFGTAFGVLPFAGAVPVVVLSSLALAARFIGTPGERPLRDSVLILVGFLGMALLDILFGLFVGSVVRQNKERRRMLEELEAARGERLRAEREAGALAERQRLAGEIHDTIAQDLTSIVLQLQNADAELDADPRGARERIGRALATARESLGEARRVLWALRPELLEGEPFDRTVQRIVKSWSERSGVEAQTCVTGTTSPLSAQIEVTLVKAVQEALANVHRHARARRVSVTLSYMGDQLSLDVQDDGKGYDPAAPAGGYGLLALRERLEAAGGRVTVESAPGEGTTVSVQVPLRRVAEEAGR
jgi:signal transduction histidine kinase